MRRKSFLPRGRETMASPRELPPLRGVALLRRAATLEPNRVMSPPLLPSCPPARHQLPCTENRLCMTSEKRSRRPGWRRVKAQARRQSWMAANQSTKVRRHSQIPTGVVTQSSRAVEWFILAGQSCSVAEARLEVGRSLLPARSNFLVASG